MYESYVINTEIVESLSNFNLLSSIKERIGKLFALSQCTFNDFERVDIAEEVWDGLVRVPAIDRRGCDGLVVCLACIGRKVLIRN